MPSDFTLGVEEELFVVDPHTLAPLRGCDDVLGGHGRFARGSVAAEMCEGVVELITPVTRDAGEAVGALADLRAGLLGRPHVVLLGTGIHPTLAFGDVSHRQGDHYDHTSRATRSLLRQSTYCGVHVHVAMPDRETTIAAYNGMRRWVPLLQALGANSPFWHGQDSGLESCRTVVCHSVPRTGLPRAFRDWDDFERSVAELCRVAEIGGIESIWWDMRPHPRLGTLEVRFLDAQASLADLSALVALVHGLAIHEATEPAADHPSSEVLAEATFRAIRDGLEATLPFEERLVGVRDIARFAADLAAVHVGADALAGVHAIVEEGNGAVRQRRAHAAGGMGAVLELLRTETAAPVALRAAA